MQGLVECGGMDSWGGRLEEELAMPTLWYLNDGPESVNTSKLGVQVSFQELREAFGDHIPKLLAKKRPQFNVDHPSRYPQRVVIEVKEEDGIDGRFPQSGFYLFNLSPEQAQQLLDNYRGKK